jgi:cell division protein FtsB
MWEVSPLALERLRRYGAAMKRFAPFIMLALSLSSLSLFFTGEGDLHALRGLQERLQIAKERNGRLQEYVQELREHNTRIKRDPRFLEHVVRNELGLVRDGEVVFVFEGAEAQKGLGDEKR